MRPLGKVSALVSEIDARYDNYIASNDITNEGPTGSSESIFHI